MEIIEAKIEHATVIVQKVAELIQELGGKPFGHDRTEVVNFASNAIAQGRYIAFLALNVGKAVGLITLEENGAVYAGGRFGVIHELFVDPDLRSRGIGKLLLDRAKEKSLDLNWRRLEVGAPSFPTWKKTVEFYLKSGFQEVGPRLKWFGNKVL